MSQPSLATDDTVRTRRPVHRAKAGPKRRSREATASSPRPSCQAMIGPTGRPERHGAPLSAMPATPTAATRSRAGPRAVATAASARRRSATSMSTPSAEGANGVAAEVAASSVPAASTTTALMRVVPTSRPSSNPSRTGAPTVSTRCP